MVPTQFKEQVVEDFIVGSKSSEYELFLKCKKQQHILGEEVAFYSCHVNQYCFKIRK